MEIPVVAEGSNHFAVDYKHINRHEESGYPIVNFHENHNHKQVLRESLSTEENLPAKLVKITIPDAGVKEETNHTDHANDELQAKMKLLEQQNQELRTQLEEMQKKYKHERSMSTRTLADKVKQDVDIEILRRKNIQLQEMLKDREHSLEMKDAEIMHLKKELDAKSETNYKMALKLLDFQTKVSSVELQLRKFPVKRIYRFYPNVDVEIILSKNPSNGVISLDVVERGRHQSRPLKDVNLIVVPEGTLPRFTVLFTDGSSDTFESEIADQIVDSLKEVFSPT